MNRDTTFVTTFVSATELRAAILAKDIAAAGTAQVRVFNPAPGGGQSNALTFTISPTPPRLTHDTTIVPVGTRVTVTLSNGFGKEGDYLTLASVGAPDEEFWKSISLNAGVTGTSWTVDPIMTPGQYEFWLFHSPNGVFTKAATSLPFTVN